jgi:hypothetical protein
MAPVKTKEQMEMDILEAQHKAALLNLDELIDTNAQRQQTKAVKQRVNAERQWGFETRRAGQERRFALCTHRQGGALNELEVDENNQAALTVLKMPDDFTVIVSCLVCRGSRVSPHPYLMRKLPFPAGFHMPGGVILEKAETAGEVRDRLAKFADDTEEFNALLKLSKKKLAKVPAMDCGATHILTNSETGEKVYPWRQSDVWPYAEPGYAQRRQKEAA